MRRRNVFLLLALVGEAVTLELMAVLGDLRAHSVAFFLLFTLAAAAFLTAYRLLSNTESLFAIVLIAAALRLPMFFTQPSLSDDVWRYLHDGRAQLAGTNPFAYAPADPHTRPFRGPGFQAINHPDLPTIYPPVAQLSFALNAWLGSSLLTWRLLLLCAELSTMLVLARLLERRGVPLRNLALYAWHPLAIIEGVGSAHLDPIGIALLMAGLWAAAQNREILAGITLGLSAGFKLVTAPLIFVTQQVRRPVLVLTAALTLSAMYGAYWVGGPPFGSLRTFALSWEANASIYSLLSWLTDGYRARILVLTLLACVLVTTRATQWRDEQRMAFCMLAILLLSPVVHAWYLLWLLGFLPLITISWLRRATLLWTITVVIAYLPTDLRPLEYAPVYGVLLWAAAKALREGSLQRTLRPLPERKRQIST